MMLSGLLRRPVSWNIPPTSIIQRAIVPRKPIQSSRPFRTSSRFNQQYRYQRFYDPEPPKGGKRGEGWNSSFAVYWRRMNSWQRAAGVLIGGGAPVFYLTHLETVEETGRRRFIFLPKSMEVAMAKGTFDQIMKQSGDKVLPDGHPATELCKRVVARLGRATGMEGVNWRVYVIDEQTPNAFVIPGGQIFVFTGILPIAKTEAGLATILGHEIAHYTLRHIAEKASLSQFFTIIGVIFAWTFGLPLDWTFQFQRLALELPNSRATEIEADYVGLLYMAKACYDPKEGPKVWERMRVMAKGSPKIPRFLSTHPENYDRQERLISHIEEALAKGAEAGCGEGYDAFARRFREGMW